MKKIMISIIAMLWLCSCGTSTQTTTTEPTSSAASTQAESLDLTGTWIQDNSSSEDMYQKAVISDASIEVYWVNESSDTESLYWAGSYDKPQDDTKEYAWDSVNDKTKTETALLASSDDTKTFTYSDDVISYDVSAMGMTQNVKLKRQN